MEPRRQRTTTLPNYSVTPSPRVVGSDRVRPQRVSVQASRLLVCLVAKLALGDMLCVPSASEPPTVLRRACLSRAPGKQSSSGEKTGDRTETPWTSP